MLKMKLKAIEREKEKNFPIDMFMITFQMSTHFKNIHAENEQSFLTTNFIYSSVIYTILRIKVDFFWQQRRV